MSPSKYLPLRIVLCLQIALLALVCVNGQQRRRFCGDTLTNAIKQQCRSSYNSRQYTNNIKRSDDGEDNAEPMTHPWFASYPFEGRFVSTAALGTRVRRDYTAVKRGIIEECCIRPCTLMQLASYCDESVVSIAEGPSHLRSPYINAPNE